MQRAMMQDGPGRNWLAMTLGIALVLGATLERFPLSLAGARIYLPHLVAIAVFPIFLSNDRFVSSVRTALLGFIAVVMVVTLPSMALPWPEVRVAFILQLFLNIFTMTVSFAVFRQLSKPSLTRLVLVCSMTLFSSSVIQLVLNPGLNARTETTMGLPHPILFFYEETWLALFASLLSVAAFGLGAHKTGIILTVLIYFIGTRSAMIVCSCSIAMLFSVVSQNRWLRFVCMMAPIAFSIWFLVDSVWGVSERIYNDSLDTRAGDIAVVRQANNDAFWPFGGQVLSVFDSSRARLVPSTSNVLGFELFWKFGLGGLIVLVVFWVLIGHTVPRLASLDWQTRAWPILVPLTVWPAMLQFNNAFGYPWMWVMLALCLSVLTVSNPSSDVRLSINSLKKNPHKRSQRKH